MRIERRMIIERRGGGKRKSWAKEIKKCGEDGYIMSNSSLFLNKVIKDASAGNAVIPKCEMSV